eukprot:TRINITY_DN29376_c0_g1_i1.p1 TRINITY_DN29376_c0_g1~~TRINITY_DN29376_c0_g1_i1.p1  ORF type:complete len:202 (+),score=47.48 TRINITY_DN29376_c0_g1_i1:461-1066(+)
MIYGFYQECLTKFGGDAGVWAAIMDAFDCLTITAVVGGSIFSVHGGLSPSVLTLDQVRVINRFHDVPRDGPVSDLLWSDPESDAEGVACSVRGAGYCFGRDVVLKFLHANRLQSIARAHQLCMEGYQRHFDGRCTTVWSAPNYCQRSGNKAALLEVDDDLMLSGCRPEHRHFNIFTEAPGAGEDAVEQWAPATAALEGYFN